MMKNLTLKRAYNYLTPVVLVLLTLTMFSCEKFFNPDQAQILKEDEFYKNWNEYRSAEMGLYSLQQKLVDQIVVLGELRGDLLEVTPYASKDLNDIYNFNISPDNAYTQPNDFYQLIGATNNLARKLEYEHPEVLDKDVESTDYDRLYGEVLCMRAWAYFNAVKIYGKIPYLWPSLTSEKEITEYINTPQVYYDVENIIYNINGYDNDTIRLDTVILEKAYLDMEMVIDTFTTQLAGRIKKVGVIHNTENKDLTWDATVWNINAYRALMGEMHLFNSNLSAAYDYFQPILYNYDPGSNIKYGLDSKFSRLKWENIFKAVEVDEHILVLQFQKQYEQQHTLQSLFSSLPPNYYMLKPTRLAVENWETIWREQDIIKIASNPEETYMEELGKPGDFYRGHHVSYLYRRGFDSVRISDVQLMLSYKSTGNYRDLDNLMRGVDTVVYKYTIDKDVFDQDANFIVYRAANIHLYCAEIYSYWLHDQGKNLNTDLNKGLSILNNGAYKDPADGNQLGVRGRVGFGSGDDAIYLENHIYIHDPYINEIIGFYDYTDNLAAKQVYLEDKIIEERARELAYEGQRFYDLMRVAKKRGDPSFLADKVAAKFSGSKAEQIREHLMNEENWYVPLPE